MKRLTIHRKGEAPATFDLASVETIEFAFEAEEAVGSVTFRPDSYGLTFQIRQPGREVPTDTLAIDLFPGKAAELLVSDTPDTTVTIWSPIQKETP